MRMLTLGMLSMHLTSIIVVVTTALLFSACEQPLPDAEKTQRPVTTPNTTAPTSAVVGTPEPTPTRVPQSLPLGAASYTSTPAPLISAVPPREDPPARDLFALAQRYGGTEDADASLTRTLPPDPDCCEVGHCKTFFVSDLIERRTYTVDACLLAVSENAYWYADKETDLTAQELEGTAEVFERDIRPPIVEVIGDIWKPGVDGDPRLTVLHTPLAAAAGYFSSSDSYPRATHPHSNEREMIVMDGDWLRPGSRQYFSVLAHEFQHAVHWNLDLGEDVWINEGMSEVATGIAGYEASFVDLFLLHPESQLNYWPDAPRATPPHYGGATLFVEYLTEHYGGKSGLAELAREPLDGVNGVESYLSRYGMNFVDVFADWTVANYLDAKLDRMDSIEGEWQLDAYTYAARSVSPHRVRQIDGDFEQTITQPQLSARYYELRLPDGDALVDFNGEATVAQVDTACHSGRYCWWGGNGDSIDTTLEREFDLSEVDEATLEFWMWHNIEEDWDYAYASISTDGGTRWTTLDGDHTTREDPLGANYGAGLTGNSGGGKSAEWVKERMDLSDYTGEESVLLRFEYITDDGVNLGGILIDDIAIPELAFTDDAETGGDWRADGFRRIDNTLPQGFILQVIDFAADGSVSVSRQPHGSFSIEGFGEILDYAVLVIAPTTYTTYQPATYSLTITGRGADSTSATPQPSGSAHSP